MRYDTRNPRIANPSTPKRWGQHNRLMKVRVHAKRRRQLANASRNLNRRTGKGR